MNLVCCVLTVRRLLYSFSGASLTDRLDKPYLGVYAIYGSKYPTVFTLIVDQYCQCRNPGARLGRHKRHSAPVV